MPKKSTKTKPEPTTKHVAISAVAHETLIVLADRYGKSMGEMVTLLIDNCYNYGLIEPGESKGGKCTVTTRIDLLEKQLKRYNDSNWKAVDEAKKTTLMAAKIFNELSELINKMS
jgi:hypothetical protein